MQNRTASDLGLRVLAKVDQLDPSAIDAIEPYEGDEPYFPDYVDADFPRDFDVTDSVVAATTEFAIADEGGDIIARFVGDKDGKSANQRAHDAVAGAKVSLNIEVPGATAETDDGVTEAGEESAQAQEATTDNGN
jgi:hypothetical protein